MKAPITNWPILLPVLLALACNTNDTSDAYGNFEATTILVGAEGNGKLLSFNLEEGQQLSDGEVVGLIDTLSLHLRKEQVMAQAAILPAKTRDAAPEIAVLRDQRENLVRERDRTLNLLKQKAATQKQLDDLNGEIAVVDQQIKRAENYIQTANRGILAEKHPIQAEIAYIDKQITDCIIKSPIDGTVLAKFAEANEVVAVGSPLFKIANLDTLKLRAYTSAALLQKTALNRQVEVLVDNGDSGLKKLQGRVAWIASEAEFTPKTIETREERVNLVYAIDVLVKNDGSLRIGMPGEVVFITANASD
jgi:HlyD family secretion protein